jgi:hypothetical protein
MAEAEPSTIRLRHYTRKSSKERILTEERLLARDQNKIFVERADHEPFNPREAEAKYLLKRGKGNAYIEFDARPEEIRKQINHLTGETEFFPHGSIDLAGRNPQGFDNH